LVRVDRQMKNSRSTGGNTTGKFNYGASYVQGFTNYPTNILEFCLDGKDKHHPTQKPVALLEYLLKTYSMVGDLVLDNCMGSGTTGVACANLDRRFTGIELDTKYFEVAKKRIETAYYADLL